MIVWWAVQAVRALLVHRNDSVNVRLLPSVTFVGVQLCISVRWSACSFGRRTCHWLETRNTRSVSRQLCWPIKSQSTCSRLSSLRMLVFSVHFARLCLWFSFVHGRQRTVFALACSPSRHFRFSANGFYTHVSTFLMRIKWKHKQKKHARNAPNVLDRVASACFILR